jgi:hypothetical protein
LNFGLAQLSHPITFVKIFWIMEAQQSTGKYWILFFLWLGILVTLMFVYREFFWLALPGTVTYFAKGMDLI